MSDTNFSLNKYFPTFNQLISQTLISPESILKIQNYAECLPGDISTFFGFECPLDTNNVSADFLFCSTKNTGKNSILAGLHPSIQMSEELFEDSAWNKVRQFCQEWENRESILYSNLSNIWLEFDIGQQLAPYSPCMFFGTATADNCTVSHSILIQEGLKLLVPEAIEGKRHQTLLKVFDRLPSSVHIFQIGAMLSRKSPAIRLCLRNIEPDEIVATLVDIGWNGDNGNLSNLIKTLMTISKRIDVDIDVGETIGNKIGLECYFGEDQKTLSLLTNFTDWLVEKQLTSQEKAQGLLSFHCLVHQDSAPQKWPAHLLHQAASSKTANYLRYWVHHIKVVHQKEAPLSAKAYLAIMPDQMDRAMFKKIMMIK